MNITINTVILVAQEIIYRNRQIGGTLVLAQVRRKLYNQMIKENSLAKFSLVQQNWDSIEDDLKLEGRKEGIGFYVAFNSLGHIATR